MCAKLMTPTEQKNSKAAAASQRACVRCNAGSLPAAAPAYDRKASSKC